MNRPPVRYSVLGGNTHASYHTRRRWFVGRWERVLHRYSSMTATQTAAIAAVAPFITDNPYTVTTTSLEVIDNPRGTGQIVYVALST